MKYSIFILLLLSSCYESNIETKDTPFVTAQGNSVEILTIDNCEYIKVRSGRLA